MPSPRYIPAEPQQPNSLGTMLSSFLESNNKYNEANRETDALKEIYGRHQQDGQNLERTLQEITSDPRISPTARVNTVNQLVGMQKHNYEMREKAQKDLEKAEKKQNESVIAKDLEQRLGLSPEQGSAYAANPGVIPKVFPKEGKVNQADRPPDADQQARIDKVMTSPEWEKATLPQKRQLLGRAGVSNANADSHIKSYIEDEKIRAENEKNKPGKEYNKLREKAVADYVTNALKQRDEAEEMEFSIDAVKKAIQGDVAGPGAEALIKNNPYGQLLIGLTPDEASLQAANKKVLQGSTGIFGTKPTEKEIFLLLNSMLPSIGKSKEANIASVYFIDKLNKLKIMHGDLVDEISKKGYVPDIESQVNERMKPMIEQYRNELIEGKKALDEMEKKSDPQQKIKVKAPDGTTWNMTQDQINAAKQKGVNFEPV